MMMNPKDKGDRSEGMILAALLKAGKTVLTPFGDNQRYDLVTEEGGTFTRIQCKTGRLREGAILFNTSSRHHHRGKGASSYRGEIELFGVYCPDNDKVYLVPVNDVPLEQGSLRLTPPRNNQKRNIRLAENYELPV